MNGRTKVKSLSLSRRTQTPPRKEESTKPTIPDDERAQLSNLEAILNSPIARPSHLCSTPRQKHVDLTEDSPDQDYFRSPTSSLYPCTQDSNEIAWDWQHKSDSTGVDKIGGNNSTTMNITPKRPQSLMKKKRSAKSYSPLLKVPTKRKLANPNNAESIGKFAAELQALADTLIIDPETQRNAKKNGDNDIEPQISAGSPKQLGIFDMETQQNVFDIHEATTLEVSYIAEEMAESKKLESSLDDLFDESVDACMIQCSQEIEEKLKVDSGIKERNSYKASTSSFGANTAAKSSSTAKIETRYDGVKEKSNSKKVSSPSEQLLEEDIPASQIPDDSFDDCLSLCMEDFSDDFSTDNKQETPKKLEAPVSSHSNNNKPSSGTILNTKNQTDDLGLLFKRKPDCLGPDKAPSDYQNRKYLKAKSLSDSYCANSASDRNGKANLNQNSNSGTSRPSPMTKSTSNYNLNQKSSANGIQNKGFSSTTNLNKCIPAAGGRNNSTNNLANKQASSTTVSYSYLIKSSENLLTKTYSTGNCDPYSRRAEASEKPLNELRTTAPSNLTQQLRYNAEEIERKRLEAKKRLEANKLKKRLLNSSSKSNGGISLQNKRPVVKR